MLFRSCTYRPGVLSKPNVPRRGPLVADGAAFGISQIRFRGTRSPRGVGWRSTEKTSKDVDEGGADRENEHNSARSYCESYRQGEHVLKNEG